MRVTYIGAGENEKMGTAEFAEDAEDSPEFSILCFLAVLRGLCDLRGRSVAKQARRPAAAPDHDVSPAAQKKDSSLQTARKSKRWMYRGRAGVASHQESHGHTE